MSRLSKSRHPAYHLRPNKAVDRLVFLDILRALELYYPLNDHVYIGFAGPYSEDFRLLAQTFPALRMISVEEDGETHKRQEFHLCSSRMELHHCTFEEFLSSGFPSEYPTITWADYTDMTRECLLEASDIARKAVPSSLLRITVRAETPVYNALQLGRRTPRRLPRTKRQAFDEFVASYRNSISIADVAFDEDLFTWEWFREERFPALLRELINTVITASCNHPKVFLPLHAVKYSDGTIMLSVTGVFCSNEECDSLRTHFESESDFFSVEPGMIDVIDVPALTTKERLHLDAVLPTSDEDEPITLDRLGYLIEGDGSRRESEYKMLQYEKYYRLYPYFGKLLP